MKWQVDGHQQHDKSISISGPLRLEVDYDDVDTSAVDLLIPHLLEVLNAHWQPQYAWRCESDDCERGWDGYVAGIGSACPSCGAEMRHMELES